MIRDRLSSRPVEGCDSNINSYMFINKNTDDIRENFLERHIGHNIGKSYSMPSEKKLTSFAKVTKEFPYQKIIDCIVNAQKNLRARYEFDHFLNQCKKLRKGLICNIDANDFTNYTEIESFLKESIKHIEELTECNIFNIPNLQKKYITEVYQKFRAKKFMLKSTSSTAKHYEKYMNLITYNQKDIFLETENQQILQPLFESFDGLKSYIQTLLYWHRKQFFSGDNVYDLSASTFDFNETIRSQIKNQIKDRQIFDKFMKKIGIQERKIRNQIYSQRLKLLKTYHRLSKLNDKKIQLKKPRVCRICERKIKNNKFKMHSEACYRICTTKNEVLAINHELTEFRGKCVTLLRNLAKNAFESKLPTIRKSLVKASTFNTKDSSNLNIQKCRMSDFDDLPIKKNESKADSVPSDSDNSSDIKTEETSSSKEDEVTQQLKANELKNKTRPHSTRRPSNFSGNSANQKNPNDGDPETIAPIKRFSTMRPSIFQSGNTAKSVTNNQEKSGTSPTNKISNVNDESESNKTDMTNDGKYGSIGQIDESDQKQQYIDNNISFTSANAYEQKNQEREKLKRRYTIAYGGNEYKILELGKFDKEPDKRLSGQSTFTEKPYRESICVATTQKDLFNKLKSEKISKLKARNRKSVFADQKLQIVERQEIKNNQLRRKSTLWKECQQLEMKPSNFGGLKEQKQNEKELLASSYYTTTSEESNEDNDEVSKSNEDVDKKNPDENTTADKDNNRCEIECGVGNVKITQKLSDLSGIDIKTEINIIDNQICEIEPDSDKNINVKRSLDDSDNDSEDEIVPDDDLSLNRNFPTIRDYKNTAPKSRFSSVNDKTLITGLIKSNTQEFGIGKFNNDLNHHRSMNAGCEKATEQIQVNTKLNTLPNSLSKIKYGLINEEDDTSSKRFSRKKINKPIKDLLDTISNYCDKLKSKPHEQNIQWELNIYNFVKEFLKGQKVDVKVSETAQKFQELLEERIQKNKVMKSLKKQDKNRIIVEKINNRRNSVTNMSATFVSYLEAFGDIDRYSYVEEYMSGLISEKNVLKQTENCSISAFNKNIDGPNPDKEAQDENVQKKKGDMHEKIDGSDNSKLSLEESLDGHIIDQRKSPITAKDDRHRYTSQISPDKKQEITELYKKSKSISKIDLDKILKEDLKCLLRDDPKGDQFPFMEFEEIKRRVSTKIAQSSITDPFADNKYDTQVQDSNLNRRIRMWSLKNCQSLNLLGSGEKYSTNCKNEVFVRKNRQNVPPTYENIDYNKKKCYSVLFDDDNGTRCGGLSERIIKYKMSTTRMHSLEKRNSNQNIASEITNLDREVSGSIGKSNWTSNQNFHNNFRKESTKIFDEKKRASGRKNVTTPNRNRRKSLINKKIIGGNSNSKKSFQAPSRDLIVTSENTMKTLVKQNTYGPEGKVKVSKVGSLVPYQNVDEQLTKEEQKNLKLKENFIKFIEIIRNIKMDEINKEEEIVFETSLVFSDTEVNYGEFDKIVKSDNNIAKMEDFQILEAIGEGYYGKVWLVRQKSTLDLYAMKIIQFDGQNLDFIKGIINEYKIFNIITGKYTVKALFSFLYKNHYCIVMDYMVGGDFRRILDIEGFLPENFVRFYSAQLVEAIKHLHAQKIIHRDLKPENIQIDNEGHLKLADFGLSALNCVVTKNGVSRLRHSNTLEEIKKMQELKNSVDKMPKFKFKKTNPSAPNCKKIEGDFEISEKESPSEDQKSPPINEKDVRTYLENQGIVGTPDYMAPEMIDGQQFITESMDWWALGIIIYEFIVGIPPFNDDTIELIHHNAKTLKMDWPDVGYGEGFVTPMAKDLIEKLLVVDPKKRLGYHSGAKEIQQHPFFEGVNWNNLNKQTPPIQPGTTITEKVINNGNEINLSVLLKSGYIEKSGINIDEKNVKEQIEKEAKNLEMVRLDLLHEKNLDANNLVFKDIVMVENEMLAGKKGLHEFLERNDMIGFVGMEFEG